MDKRYTWDRRSNYRVILFLLLLTSFSTFGQCDSDSIMIIQVDSCNKIIMSPKKFTEFYLYKKNLEKIKRTLPDVEKKLDSLNAINDLIEESLQKEIEITNKDKSLVIQSLDQCTTTLTKVDIENSYLTKQVGELKSRQWKMFGYGTTVGVLTAILIKILVQ